ncbi:hypothetical protein C8Q74DRAFT_114961 [Fomes fomentarius]|nr:hypothetical protein C8Q74DRAFT_114961 [Fomes fomentarius]
MKTMFVYPNLLLPTMCFAEHSHDLSSRPMLYYSPRSSGPTAIRGRLVNWSLFPTWTRSASGDGGGAAAGSTQFCDTCSTFLQVMPGSRLPEGLSGGMPRPVTSHCTGSHPAEPPPGKPSVPYPDRELLSDTVLTSLDAS